MLGVGKRGRKKNENFKAIFSSIFLLCPNAKPLPRENLRGGGEGKDERTRTRKKYSTKFWNKIGKKMRNRLEEKVRY